MTHISFSSLFRKNNMGGGGGGGENDWVGKKLTSQIFPQGKKTDQSVFSPGKEWAGPFFPGEKTDWGKN